MSNLPGEYQEYLANARREFKLAQPFVLPAALVRKEGMEVRLWVAQRKMPALMAGMPFLTRHQALIVPVSPDMKMAFGVAKIARDQGAARAEREAMRVAPMAQGEAFLASGAQYRYAQTALAVIFDDYKRTDLEAIVRAYRKAAELARQRDCIGLILPDITPNIISQPNWVTSDKRREAAELSALSMIQVIRSCKGLMTRFHLWCPYRENVEPFRRELERL